MSTKKNEPTYEEEGTVTIKAAITGEDKLIRKPGFIRKMTRDECERGLIQLLGKAAKDYEFSLTDLQTHFTAQAIVVWVEEHFHCYHDPT